MPTSMIVQRIGFISATKSFDTNALLNDPTILNIISNALGKAYQFGYQSYGQNLSDQVISSFFFIDVTINPSYQATLQGLLATITASFPQYTVFTYGYAVQFGA